MLVVRTYTGQSSIQGIGLFAAEQIPKGTQICHWTGIFEKVFTPMDIELLPKLAREFIEKYAWRYPKNGDIFILPLDDERFINHNLKPNMDNDGVAIIDINKDDEILADYYEFDDSEKFETIVG